MMLSYINNFFIGVSLSFLLNDFFDRRYPNEYNIFIEYITNLFVNVSYNCIYYYSKCQIFFSKYIETNKFYLKVTELIKMNSKKNGLDVLFIKDNFQYNNPVDFPDLIIVTNLSKSPPFKRVTYNENYKEVTFQESDIKFMLIEFIIGEKYYKIDLKTDSYNYYMIGNKFSKDFFIYFINQYILSKYEQHKTNKDKKYVLKIIDHNVNKFEIYFTDKNESILLEKTGYKLELNNHNDK